MTADADRPAWRETFDRVRTWHMAIELIKELQLDPWSTWDCPACGQPSPSANPDRDPEVFVVCGYCGHDWIVEAPEWMTNPQ